MRSITCLAALVTLLVGCDKLDGSNPSSKTDMAATHAEQATHVARPDEQTQWVSKVPEAQDIVGTWNVTLAVDSTTCPQATRGDVKQRQWLLGYEQGKFTMRVLGAESNEATEYEGQVESGSEPPRLVYTAARGAVSIKAWLTGEGKLEGERVVSSSNGSSACIITYKLTARRV